MEYSDLILARKSNRDYLDRPVEEEKLMKVLEAMRWAPTADNRQPFVFYVVRDREIIARMKEVYDRKWFYTAPVVICAFVEMSKAWVRKKDGKNYGEVDVAIAMDHLILEAANQGLGTCWIAAFDPEALKRILDVPDHLEPVVLTPLGYPANGKKNMKRKP